VCLVRGPICTRAFWLIFVVSFFTTFLCIRFGAHDRDSESLLLCALERERRFSLEDIAF
jgi:hypothetical protein